MVQIVGRAPTAGQTLATGLGEGFKRLAQQKMEQVQQRNYQERVARGLESAGYNQEQAQGLSGLPENILKNLVGGQTQENEFKRQKYIDSANKTWNTQFDKSLNNAQRLYDLGLKMKEALLTGEVSSGAGGYAKSLVPGGLVLNDSSRLFQTAADEIAPIIASQAGIPTNFKIKLAQSIKPNLNQSPEVQMRLVDEILKQAQKMIDKDEIRAQLIAENNGLQPSNLGSLVESRYKQRRKEAGIMKEADEDIDEIDEFRRQAIEANKKIGSRIQLDNGSILYWNGEDFTPEKPV